MTAERLSVNVDGTTITVTRDKDKSPDGRDVFKYYLAAPTFTYEGNDLKSGTHGSTLQEAFESLLVFLVSSSDEEWPPAVNEWRDLNAVDILAAKLAPQR